ncbi:MAG: DUF3126 family protein [Hyphomicrobiales bacterium]|nr:DUF3126 family protein [Hyphomicrobiales bacterium]
MDKVEQQKLQAFLRRNFGAQGLKVRTDPRNTNAAEVTFGERVIGAITLDTEDGDRSFAYEMKLPVQRDTLQAYVRKLFENDRLKIMSRAKKTDSVELLNDGEFLGVISADNAAGSSFTLQMAILDIDLDDDEL